MIFTKLKTGDWIGLKAILGCLQGKTAKNIIVLSAGFMVFRFSKYRRFSSHFVISGQLLFVFWEHESHDDNRTK